MSCPADDCPHVPCLGAKCECPPCDCERCVDRAAKARAGDPVPWALAAIEEAGDLLANPHLAFFAEHVADAVRAMQTDDAALARKVLADGPAIEARPVAIIEAAEPDEAAPQEDVPERLFDAPPDAPPGPERA
jgi:hypothetical protein